MKKFLFTLVALLMAGSAFADDYCYIDNFEVAQNQLNTNITVPVKAHLDAAVNAMQVNLTLPEGMTLRKITKGTSLNATYFDDFGDEWEAEQTIFIGNVNTTNFAWTFADAGYYEVDGEWLPYGSIKLLPGEYNEIATLTIRVAADFQGGEIIVETKPSCGNDPRPDVTPCPADQDHFKTAIVTVEGATPDPEALAGTVDVTFNGNVATLSYNVNDPSATAVVTVNDVETEVEWNRAAHTATWTAPINTTPGTYTYVVKLTVTGDGTNFVGSLSDTDTYTYTIKEKTATPEIIIDETHHNFVKFHVEGDGEVLVYIDGDLATPDANGYYYVYASTTADVTYVVTATAQEEGKDISDPATKTIEIAQWDSVNELVNGKTVAGVRYYNMAGQEMQQANGMTIVVTTYTDGTTSAVKVMK